MNIEQGGGLVPPIPESETQLEGLRRENKQLAAENEALRVENRRWEELATKDPLTGMLNRRGLDENLQYLTAQRSKELGEQRREGKKKAFAILLVDIDNFKVVNDAYGHQAGDQALLDLSHYLKTLSRKTDMVCRWGGEEFVVAFRDADAQDIINKFYNKERGKAAIEFETVINGEPMTITLSGGVVDMEPGETLEEAVARADELLYAAKHEGKAHLQKIDKEQ